MWYCYLLKNYRQTYIGISNDPWERLKKHNSKRGAKATRDGGYRMIGLIRGFSTRSSASKVESLLKRSKGERARLQKLKALGGKEICKRKHTTAEPKHKQRKRNK